LTEVEQGFFIYFIKLTFVNYRLIMKINVEQIVIEEHILVYSKYVRDSVTLDEDGADYEYDFDAFISNLDSIQNIVLRLYGERGLVQVVEHFADGAEGSFAFEAIEFEENATLMQKIRTLQGQDEVGVTENVSEEMIVSNGSDLPSDDSFVLRGWLEALAVNDDLSVMKMVGQEASNASEDMKERCKDRLAQEFSDLTFEGGKYYQFNTGMEQKVAVVLENAFFLLSVDDLGMTVTYPGNEFQDRNDQLFRSSILVRKSYKLKKSIIIEVNVGPEEYYMLFNVTSSKFESKKLNLTK
jgi:hypothetical protein